MEENEKPLKLGQLWMMTTSGFKKVFKSRFCILTNKIQLIWYKKQEDHLEGKKGGSIKKLESCTLDEAGIRTLPSGQEIYCFSINASHKTIIGTETERERVNWIVEILKFRGIGGLIGIVNDEEHKLRRHAAYALCNLAGRSRDDTQVRIVRENGIHCLLEFQKTIKEADLIDSINYALCKLSTQEENKVVLAMNLDHLFGLVLSSNERWMDFGLQTLQNCSTHKDVQEKIFVFGGTDTLLDVFCCKEVLKESLLLMTAECLLHCIKYEPSKKFVSNNLAAVPAIMPKFTPPVQEMATKILIECMIGDEENVISDTDVVGTLVPLIVSPLESLQEQVLFLLAKLTRTEPHSTSLRTNECLKNVLVTITSENEAIVLFSLKIIFDIWCNDEYICDLAVLGDELKSFDSLLGSSENIMNRTVEILKYISIHKSSCELFANYHALLNAILPKLLKIQTTESPAVPDVLITLRNLSQCAAVKTILSQKFLNTELIRQLSDHSNNRDIIFSNLYVLCQCATTAVGKVYLRTFQAVEPISVFLTNADLSIQRLSTKLLGLMLCSYKMRVHCGKIVKEPLLLLLASTEDSLQKLACIAIENFAFDNASELSSAVLPLIELIDSKNEKVVVCALSALLNFCSVRANMVVVLTKGFPKLLKTLSSDCSLVRERTMHLMSVALAETDGIEFTQQQLLIETLTPYATSDSEHLLYVILVLSKFSKTESNQKALSISPLLQFIFEQVITAECVVLLELCLEIFNSCVAFCPKHKQRQILGKQTIIERCVLLTKSFNSVVQEFAIKILFQCSQIETSRILFSDIAHAALYDCMSSTTEIIRTMASKTLLNLIQKDDKTIPVNDLKGLTKLLSSWREILGDKAITGLTVKVENGTKIQLQSAQTNILTICHPSEESMVHTTASALAQPNEKSEGTIQTSVQQLAVPETLKKKKSRKSSSRAFVIASRSRAPRSRASTMGISREAIPEQVQMKKRGYSLYKQQICALSTYRNGFDEKFRTCCSSFKNLVSVELVKHVGPMDSSFVPLLDDFSLRHKDDDSLLSIESVDSAHIIEYSDKIFVISSGRAGAIGMGMTTENYPLDQQPGWCDGGWGYHGDDGNKYWFANGKCNNDFFGPCYGARDVIGCGINNVTSQMFFTKNGFVIDTIAFDNMPTDTQNLYPFVCLGSHGEKIFLNFGQIPFLWNFDIEHTFKEPIAAPKAEYGQNQSKMKREPTIRVYEAAVRNLLKDHPVVAQD